MGIRYVILYLVEIALPEKIIRKMKELVFMTTVNNLIVHTIIIKSLKRNQ